MKLIGKSLQISYDEQGNKYDLPVFAINQPARFDIKDQQVVDYAGKTVSIKFQYLNFNETLELSLDETVGEILAKLKPFVKKSEDYDESVSALRLVYRGKVLSEGMKIGNYIKGNDLIQIFKTLKAS